MSKCTIHPQSLFPLERKNIFKPKASWKEQSVTGGRGGIAQSCSIKPGLVHSSGHNKQLKNRTFLVLSRSQTKAGWSQQVSTWGCKARPSCHFTRPATREISQGGKPSTQCLQGLLLSFLSAPSQIRSQAPTASITNQSPGMGKCAIVHLLTASSHQQKDMPAWDANGWQATSAQGQAPSPV